MISCQPTGGNRPSFCIGIFGKCRAVAVASSNNNIRQVVDAQNRENHVLRDRRRFIGWVTWQNAAVINNVDGIGDGICLARSEEINQVFNDGIGYIDLPDHRIGPDCISCRIIGQHRIFYRGRLGEIQRRK